MHLKQGRIERIFTTADGLPTDHLTALARDAQGTLWIGTWGAGLRRLRNRAFVVFGAAERLSHDNVRAVLHGRDGVSWVSTAGGGLNCIEGDQLTVLGKKDALPTEEISALVEDRDGSLWIGTYTAGLAHRQSNGRIETYGTAEGLPGAEIRSMLQDREGQLWVGTRAGLARFNGKRFEPVRSSSSSCRVPTWRPRRPWLKGCAWPARPSSFRTRPRRWGRW